MNNHKMQHFINNKWVGENELVIPVRDLGFLRGYAVFDFLRTYNNKPFKIAEHIDRLYRSADLIGLKISKSRQEIKELVDEAVKRNTNGQEKFIKIIVSGGVSDSMLVSSDPTIIIMIDNCTVYPAENYENGVGVITVKFNRYMPEAKTNNYIEGVRQSQIAKESGAVEPVYYDDRRVFEGSNSNIFALVDGRLLTPKSNILEGITRNVLLEILKLDVEVCEEDFSIEQLRLASEVFFTGSGKEVMPITKIDSKFVGDGKVGAVTREVIRQFRQYTQSDKWYF